MFQIHPGIKSIQVDRNRIVTIIESINMPMIAAAERPTQPTKAFIVGVRNPSGMFTIYIYLHLMETKECLIYLCSPAEIAMNSYHEVELEALQFVESMGFMVDNLHFRNLPPEHQTALLEEIPVTHEDLEEFARRCEAQRATSEKSTEEGAGGVSAPSENVGVLELNEVAEGAHAQPGKKPVLSQDALAKIVRLLASF